MTTTSAGGGEMREQPTDQDRDRWMRAALGHLAPAGTWPAHLLRLMWHARNSEEAISIAKHAQKRMQTLWGSWDTHVDAALLGESDSWNTRAPARSGGGRVAEVGALNRLTALLKWAEKHRVRFAHRSYSEDTTETVSKNALLDLMKAAEGELRAALEGVGG